MPYQYYFTTIKNNQENSSSALQQSTNWILSSSSETDNIIQEGQVIFQKNSIVSLPEVFKLIDSAISKRQGDRRKLSFLERKKIQHKRDNGFTISIQNITSLDGSGYEAIQSSISENIFSYLKMFSMQCRKNITVEDNKIRMNITNFINIYTSIHTYIIYHKNDWK